MQNANEKMVPIDTSGDPVEVELNDEKEQVEVREEPQKEIEVQQEEVVEQKEEPEKEVPADPYETGDLDNYSKGVKKRINNLVGRMREMERLYETTQKENEILKNNIIM